jgi:hypothetical protein
MKALKVGTCEYIQEISRGVFRVHSTRVAVPTISAQLYEREIRGLYSQGLGVAHGDDDPSPGVPSVKFKLEDVLDAPSRCKGILRKSRRSQKYDAPQGVSTSFGELMDDGVGCAASKNANPKKPGLEHGYNVTSLFLK